MTIRIEKQPAARVWSRGLCAGASIVPAMLLLFSACSDDPSAPGDTTPPAKVLNLVAINPSSSSIMLTWTAPGDDERTGTAAQYDIRYSTNPLTDAIWPSAKQATGEPPPKPAGSVDTFVVTGLDPASLYYFSLKTADPEGNWSPKSIIASALTTPESLEKQDRAALSALMSRTR